MIFVFGNPTRILHTSHKVMTSTLLLQNHLLFNKHSEIPDRHSITLANDPWFKRPQRILRFLYSTCIIREHSEYSFTWGRRGQIALRYLSGTTQYLLVRNPKDRFQAFYQHIWQECQDSGAPSLMPNRLRYLLFALITQQHYGGPLDKQHSANFLKFSFEECVLALPKALETAYSWHPQFMMYEPHMRPQSTLPLIPHQRLRILKMESEEDLSFMKETLRINTDIRTNQGDNKTKKSLSGQWTKEMCEVIHKVYEGDFRLLSYDPYV